MFSYITFIPTIFLHSYSSKWNNHRKNKLEHFIKHAPVSISCTPPLMSRTRAGLSPVLPMSAGCSPPGPASYGLAPIQTMGEDRLETFE